MEERRSIPLWLASSGIIGLVVLIYWPSLSHPYVWTDHGEIEQLSLVPTSWDELADTLIKPKGVAKGTDRNRYQAADRPAGRFAYWRPVKAISYGLDHQIGRGAPWSYHLTNLLLHAGACLALLILLRRWTGRRLPGVAEAAALLQAVSPLHVEAVAWISARSDLLVAGFSLTACWVLLRARQASRPVAALALRCAAGLLAALALGSKESGLVALPLAVIVSGLVPDPRRTSVLKRLAIECGPLVACIGALVAFRLLVVADVRIGLMGSRAGLGFWTLLDLFGRNLLASALPITSRLADTIEVRGLPSLAAWLGSATCLAWLILGLRLRVRQPLVLVGALGFLVSLAPVSQLLPLLQPRGDRYLYLPAAWCAANLGLLIGWGLERRAAMRWLRPVVLGALAVALAGLAWKSSHRLADWSDERRLFGQAVLEQPNCAECWNNLAYAEALAGRYEQAVTSCDRALAVDRERYRGARDGFSVRWIRARALLLLERGDQACESLEEILVHAGPNPAILAMLAQAHLQAERPDMALQAIERALELNPGDRNLRGLWTEAARRRSEKEPAVIFEYPYGCVAPRGQ